MRRISKLTAGVGCGVMSLLVAGASVAQPAGTPGKATDPPKAPAPTPPPVGEQPKADESKGEKPGDAKEYKTAEELLTALESADKAIKTLSAKLHFVTVANEAEANDKQFRSGTLFFRNRSDAKTGDGQPAPDSNVAAAVRFSTLTLPSGRQQAEHKTYILNGRERVERLEDEKQITVLKQAPGQPEMDPLKLGEGPFPLPIGQQKSDVLKRFEAELVPALDQTMDIPEGFKAILAGAYQLKLKPKPGMGIPANLLEVRVWYLKKDLFPVMARFVHPGGEREEFLLLEQEINKPLPQGVFDTSVPPGWKVEEKVR